jgi:hypothetical protein
MKYVAFHVTLFSIVVVPLTLLPSKVVAAVPVPVEVQVTFNVTDFAKLIIDTWRSSSAEAKKEVPVEQLLRGMNLLIGRRESFQPKLRAYIVSRSNNVTELRSAAAEMVAVSSTIEDMLRRLNPKFTTEHSEVHIHAVSVANTRAGLNREVLIFLTKTGGSGKVEHARLAESQLLQRLEAGTCDLRRVLRHLRTAEGIDPGPLSERDKQCKVK